MVKWAQGVLIPIPVITRSTVFKLIPHTEDQNHTNKLIVLVTFYTSSSVSAVSVPSSWQDRTATNCQHHTHSIEPISSNGQSLTHEATRTRASSNWSSVAYYWQRFYHSIWYSSYHFKQKINVTAAAPSSTNTDILWTSMIPANSIIVRVFQSRDIEQKNHIHVTLQRTFTSHTGVSWRRASRWCIPTI